MSVEPLLEVSQLGFSYPPRRGETTGNRALDGIAFHVERGEIFGLLGPNGGGKTTLFRILATLLTPTDGRARLAGHDVATSADAVRRNLGVVFQSPSIDLKLTVRENMRHQGHLYGLSGSQLDGRIQELLARMGLQERADDLTETLSGGMRRRVDLAKGLLHRPTLILLDEPTTGLDPGARLDLWHYLKDAQKRDGLTVLLTTHLMEDADRCDRLAIVDRGKIIAEGTPDGLRETVGGDVVVARAKNPAELAAAIQSRFHESAEIFDDQVRIRRQRGAEFVPQLFDAFPGEIQAISVGKPTLEDVFIQHTGHRLWGVDGQ
jgi:ABC-2 type transport system ATP-binding protein